MSKHLIRLAALVAWAVSCQQPAPSGLAETSGHVIDGTDDRIEYGQTTGGLRLVADATALVVDSSKVNCGAGGSCVLNSTAWTTAFAGTGGSPGADGGIGGANGGFVPQRLCSGVRFRGQPTLGGTAPLEGCSGVMVGPRIVATSNQCATTATCPNLSVVFGFDADSTGNNVPAVVPPEQVFKCVRVTSATSRGWMMMTLDRDVPRASVTANPSVATTTPALIGYPFGLPAKISPSGRFSNGQLATDAFVGNHGGPVVDSATGTVLGVLEFRPSSLFVWSSDTSGACVKEPVSAAASPSSVVPALPNAGPVLQTPQLIVASVL